MRRIKEKEKSPTRSTRVVLTVPTSETKTFVFMEHGRQGWWFSVLRGPAAHLFF